MVTTETVIKTIMPACKSPAAWGAAFDHAFDRFWIEEPADKAALLAQVAHESVELTRLEENLSYTAERLRQVWPSRFKSIEFARRYERAPHRLADYVYSNRLGNLPDSMDAWNFRGRGPIMITGRKNYQGFAESIGEPLVVTVPDMLLTKTFGAMGAAWFWTENKLSLLAVDNPGDDIKEDFDTITRRVSGGLHGQEARARYWTKARSVYGLKEV